MLRASPPDPLFSPLFPGSWPPRFFQLEPPLSSNINDLRPFCRISSLKPGSHLVVRDLSGVFVNSAETPQLELASPRRKVKNNFLGDFLAVIVP